MRRFIGMLLCVLLCCPRASAAEGAKYVALTFDDGPSGKFTRRLLEGLAERDAPATFLLCGYRIREYPDLVTQIADQGHEIGIHGYSHKNMKTLSRRDIAGEIMDTQALIPEGIPVVFMRPPGGCCTDGVRQVSRARGLAILDWSVDPRDWAVSDAAAIHTAVVERVQDGDIVLLHDMSDSSVDAALKIVDHLRAEGFTFVTVSQLARLRQVAIKPGEVYRCFPKREEADK